MGSRLYNVYIENHSLMTRQASRRQDVCYYQGRQGLQNKTTHAHTKVNKYFGSHV